MRISELDSISRAYPRGPACECHGSAGLCASQADPREAVERRCARSLSVRNKSLVAHARTTGKPDGRPIPQYFLPPVAAAGTAERDACDLARDAPAHAADRACRVAPVSQRAEGRAPWMSLMANLRRSSLTKRSGAPSPSIGCCAWHPCARFSTSAVYRSNSSGNYFACRAFLGGAARRALPVEGTRGGSGFLVALARAGRGSAAQCVRAGQGNKYRCSVAAVASSSLWHAMPCSIRYEERQRRGRRARDLQHRLGQTRNAACDGWNSAFHLTAWG